MAIYLELDGVKGNVTAEGYENQINIFSLSFGVSRHISMEAGAMANRESSKPSLSSIMLTKESDNSVTELFKLATVGNTGKKATISFVNTGSDKLNKFMSYELTDCMIASYSISASGEGGKPMENIELSYSKIEVSYTDADSTGKAGGPLRAGYDLNAGKSV